MVRRSLRGRSAERAGVARHPPPSPRGDRTRRRAGSGEQWRREGGAGLTQAGLLLATCDAVRASIFWNVKKCCAIGEGGTLRVPRVAIQMGGDQLSRPSLRILSVYSEWGDRGTNRVCAPPPNGGSRSKRSLAVGFGQSEPTKPPYRPQHRRARRSYDEPLEAGRGAGDQALRSVCTRLPASALTVLQAGRFHIELGGRALTGMLTPSAEPPSGLSDAAGPSAVVCRTQAAPLPGAGPGAG
jgi:hypothetical protein